MTEKDRKVKPIILEKFEEPTTISNVVEYFSNYISNKKTDESDDGRRIIWMKYVHCDFNDPQFGMSKNDVVFIVGKPNGIQVFELGQSDGIVNLLYSHSGVQADIATILQTPVSSENSAKDKFKSVRPIILMIIGARISFLSMQTNTCVSETSWRNPLHDVNATFRVIVAASQREIVLLSPSTLTILTAIVDCRAGSQQTGVVCALSDLWLAFSDRAFRENLASDGGDLTEYSEIPWSASVLQAYDTWGAGDRGIPQEDSAGIVTILNVQTVLRYVHTDIFDFEKHPDAVVVHFKAFLWTMVARMTFDSSGTLLLAADTYGLVIHLFRIAPHPSQSGQAAVLHLYRLRRGDIPCSVVSMTISKDARLAAAASSHGTVHVWPISSYGGPVCVRTHCQRHVVNRLSRLQRSAGLQEYQVTRAAIGQGLSNSPNHWFHPLCPWLPPFPLPCVIPSYTQLKPVPPQATAQPVLLPLFQTNPVAVDGEQFCRSEPLLVLASDNRLLQYLLQIRSDPLRQPSPSRTEVDGPFLIDKLPRFQWRLPSISLPDVLVCSIHQQEPVKRRRMASNSRLCMRESAILQSVINVAYGSETQPTPQCWFSSIEIHSQIYSARSLRKQEKFSISTYQGREPPAEARLEVLHRSPSTGSQLSASGTQPVHVPSSEQRIQLCNSFCGSSVSSSLAGSVERMSSVLQHAIHDADEPLDHGTSLSEEPIESLVNDISQVRLRRISGSFSLESGRHIALSSSPTEADIQEEFLDPELPGNERTPGAKRVDKRRVWRN